MTTSLKNMKHMLYQTAEFKNEYTEANCMENKTTKSRTLESLECRMGFEEERACGTLVSADSFLP